MRRPQYASVAASIALAMATCEPETPYASASCSRRAVRGSMMCCGWWKPGSRCLAACACPATFRAVSSSVRCSCCIRSTAPLKSSAGRSAAPWRDPIGIQLVPEETKIFRGWRVHFYDLRSELKLEPGFRQHILHADPGHQFDDAKGARDWVVFQHSQIGHHADGELLAQSRPFPPSGAVEKSRAGDVVTPLRKPSPLMMSDN